MRLDGLRDNKIAWGSLGFRIWRKRVMEFWVGLSVGMHLGKIVADYLQKFVDAYGLLDATTLREMKTIEEAASEISSVADAGLDSD
jgi:hypothetical protein